VFNTVMVADHHRANRWHAFFARSLLREARADPMAPPAVIQGRALIRSIAPPRRFAMTPTQPLASVIGAILAEGVLASRHAGGE
jgi:hypothetical protein